MLVGSKWQGLRNLKKERFLAYQKTLLEVNYRSTLIKIQFFTLTHGKNRAGSQSAEAQMVGSLPKKNASLLVHGWF
mgnify:FL=1